MRSIFKNNWHNIGAILMLFVAVGSHPYSYYKILQWVVCGIAIYNVYIYKEKGGAVWMWIFGVVAVVFNPLFPFLFTKSIWQNLDIIGAAIFVFSIFDFKTIKELLKEIKAWKLGWSKYLVYSRKLTFWLYLNRWRRFRLIFKNHFGIIKRVCLVAVAFLIGLIASHFGNITIPGDVLSNYFIAIGAMIGGAISIIFSISVFLLQGIADLYSSKHIEEYTNSWKDQAIYIVVIIITLLFLGAGLLVGQSETIKGVYSSWIIVGSLSLVGLVFGFIDWQYELVRKKISPVNGILFLEKKGIYFLRELQYNAGKIAGLVAIREEKFSNEMALAAAYNHVLKPFIDDLDKQIETLVEVSIKLADRQEIETTKRGFTAIHNLLIMFLEARKTSSIVIPSSVAFLAVESDSQSFLTSNFERLNKAGEKFINDGKEEVAAHIITIYNSLSVKAKEINFVSQRNENPILSQLVGYLNLFIENGKRLKNIEVVYQGGIALSNIALICAEKGLDDILYGIQDNIKDIAIFGLTEKNSVVVDRCTTSYLLIIEAVFVSKKIVPKYHFDRALKNIALITNYSNTLIKSGYLPDNFTTRISLSKGYDEFYVLIVKIVNYYFTLTDEQEKRRYRTTIVQLFESVNSNLRKLSENVKSCDSTLTDSIGRLLFNINNLIIELYNNEEFVDQQKDFINRLGWNIYLPSWFVHYADEFDSGSNAFDTLTDSVAKTGVLVIEKLKNKKLAADCIDTLSNMTKYCLDKATKSYGYNEPRVLKKACYLGILALKEGWDDVFSEIGLKVYEFEPQYFEKYLTDVPNGIDPMNHNVMGLPHHDELIRELWRWRDDFEREKRNGTLGIRDDAESMMYEFIDRIDIDRFIFAIWGVLIAGTEFEVELELKLARKKLIKTLKKVGLHKV